MNSLSHIFRLAMWDVMSFSLRWPPKIHSTVRMISFRPNLPRLWSVADEYLCSLHISLPDWLETVNVINFEVSIYVSLQTVTLPPNPAKVGILSLHIGNSLLKSFQAWNNSPTAQHIRRGWMWTSAFFLPKQ